MVLCSYVFEITLNRNKGLKVTLHIHNDNNNSGFLHSAHVWHDASPVSPLLLPWLYSTAAITALEYFKELIPAMQVPIYLTSVECGKCKLMSCQRTLVLRRGLEPRGSWFTVWRRIHSTTTPLHHN